MIKQSIPFSETLRQPASCRFGHLPISALLITLTTFTMRMCLASLTAEAPTPLTNNDKNYSGYSLYRVIPQHSAHIEVIRGLGALLDSSGMVDGSHHMEIWKESRRVGHPTDILLSPHIADNVASHLRRAGLIPQLRLANVGALLGEGEAAERKGPIREPAHYHPQLPLPTTTTENEDNRGPGVPVPAAPPPFSSKYSQLDLDGEYHSHEEIMGFLNATAEEYGEFVTRGSLGKSFEGRDLAYLKTSNLPHLTKPTFFIDAGMHAREWIATALALQLIRNLTATIASLNSTPSKETITALLHSIDVLILPLANPDGYEYSRSGDRLWRKTRSHPTTGSSPCRGADPNRNFPYAWGVGASAWPCRENYQGPRPLSEVECSALADFLAANNASLRGYLSLHSYGNMIIHPWGNRGHSYPANVEELRRVGRLTAEAIRRAGGPNYRVGSSPDLLYAASGASDDYAKSVGIEYVYTMEVTNTRYAFMLPKGMISTAVRPLIEGILAMMVDIAKVAVPTSK